MEPKRPNWYVRILIVILCIFIGWLIYTNFACSTPPAQISSGLLVLVAFLAILVLSEAFDNFSIGKLLTINRKLNEKENLNKELKKENTDLRNQIINVTTSMSQKQVNSTFVLTDEIARSLKIKRADEEEINQKKNEETAQTTSPPPTTTTFRETSSNKYIPIRFFEDFLFKSFLAAEGLDQYNLLREAKFGKQFQEIDPISESSPIFDGYINTQDAEIFIELRQTQRVVGSMQRDSLYVMLSKIYYYRTVKKVNAYLYLVFLIPPDGNSEPTLGRLSREFEPAITSGLLRIKTVSISQGDFDKVLADATG